MFIDTTHTIIKLLMNTELFAMALCYTTCQYVFSLVVSLPIRRGPVVPMDVSVWDHRVLDNQIYYALF